MVDRKKNEFQLKRNKEKHVSIKISPFNYLLDRLHVVSTAAT